MRGRRAAARTVGNSVRNVNAAVATGRAKNKWVAFALCLFGAHKFCGHGASASFAGGLFLIGIIIDLIALLSKPNPHYI